MKCYEVHFYEDRRLTYAVEADDAGTAERLAGERFCDGNDESDDVGYQVVEVRVELMPWDSEEVIATS